MSYEDAWDEASLRKLLCTLARCEMMEDLLMWGSQPEKLRTSIMCSDLFWWATADSEEIGPDDIDVLQKCYDDLQATAGKETWWTASLYACRKRNMRPQGPWYGYTRRAYVEADVEALFDACGPEREDSPKIPKPAEQVEP